MPEMTIRFWNTCSIANEKSYLHRCVDILRVRCQVDSDGQNPVAEFTGIGKATRVRLSTAQNASDLSKWWLKSDTSDTAM